MTGRDFLHAAACHLAWLDGHDDGTNGMLAILFVLRNRVKMLTSDLGTEIENMWEGVSVEVPDVRDPSFQQVLDLVDNVFDEATPLADRLTNGALMWGDGRWSKLCTQVAKVGNLMLWVPK